MSQARITIQLAEFKTTNPAPHLLIDMKEDKTSFNPLQPYESAVSEITSCIAILKAKINKVKTPERVVRTLLVSLTCSVGPMMLTAYLRALPWLSQLDNTTHYEINTGDKDINGNTIMLQSSLSCTDGGRSPRFLGGSNQRNCGLPDDSVIPCARLANAACAALVLLGPSPGVMLTFGIVFPASILLADMLITKISGISLFHPARWCGNQNQLSDVDNLLINLVSQKYNIELVDGDSIEDKLFAFRNALHTASTKLAIMRHFQQQFQQQVLEIKACFHQLFSHALPHEGTRNLLFTLICEYADSGQELEVANLPARVAFKRGIRQHDRPIGRFFHKLLNEKDEDQNDLYKDKEKTIQTIFEFANIAKLQLR